MRVTWRVWCVIAMAVVMPSPTEADQNGSPPRADLRPARAPQPPVIDGLLDDEVWRGGPVPTGEWLSYNPLRGNPIPQQTEVWISYDADYLYFAFNCLDPDPNGIKTSITRRDNIWPDDWVGLSLDALGTGQMSYHMMVNPSGVQLDMLNSASGNEDDAPDWVWESASRLTETGYTAEIRLPLQSIRFHGGAEVRMGILFWRRVSRSGVSVVWPALEPSEWVFDKHVPLIFADLGARPPREVIPSVTYARAQARETPDRWGNADGKGDLGFSTKVGITSTVTLDATLNPDFSQVESDAFQVDVNQRFPVFYSEKRPFFMEGVQIFDLPGQGEDNSLQAAVHTRRIIDPSFGAKLTGSTGRLAFATLTAVDEAAGRLLPPDSPDADNDRVFNIARAQYAFGPSNYVGAIVTDTEFAGGNNRVAGADFSWRASPTQKVNGFVLGSTSRAPHERAATSGMGAQLGYSYSTRKFYAGGYAEHYDREFQMDTAFINRVGITSGSAFVERNFYPTKFSWLHRASIFSFTQGGRDRVAGGDDLNEVAGVRFNLTRQGFVRFDKMWGHEPWAGQRFSRGRARAIAEAQLFQWLRLEGRYQAGPSIFYDAINPFQGYEREIRTEVTVQPNGRLSQLVEHQRIAFDREATGERVYTLNIINSRTTYQFTRQFFLRGILQYDSLKARILTDFLASYELRPGTVVFAGYGSLIEERDFEEGRWIPNTGKYQAVNRGLFFKASYLHRF